MTTKEFTGAFELNITAEQAFLLFSPEGEKLWSPGWDYSNVMGTNILSDDYIFATQSHDHGQSDAVWIIKKYDPSNYHVEYYKIEPGHKVGAITVKCTNVRDSASKVTVRYKYSGLSEIGNDFIESYSEADYSEFIAQWKTLIEEYLYGQG